MRSEGDCIPVLDLMVIAGALLSEGENTEYDRAAVEIVGDVLGISLSEVSERVNLEQRLREAGEKPRNQKPAPFSPGPWYTSKDAVPEWHVQVTVSAENGERVATVFETEANAHLIAAAPDLLAVAQEILAACDATLLVDDKARTRPLYNQLRAVIAKATGQDS